MANMDKPAYQGKALSPGQQLSQGQATSDVATGKTVPKNEPPMTSRTLRPEANKRPRTAND